MRHAQPLLRLKHGWIIETSILAELTIAKTTIYTSTSTMINQTEIARGIINKILSTTAASLSIVGTLIIIITFVMWPEFRTNSRRMIVFISIGDFLVACANIVGIWDGEHGKPSTACQIQATIGAVAVLSSLFWTVYLSLYFYLTICRKISTESETRIMHLFHITAWGVPLTIAIVAYILKAFGYSADVGSSGWCWISWQHSWWNMVLWMFIAGKGWEILAYIAITVFYVLVKLHIRREVSEGFVSGSPFLTVESVEVVKKADRKLTFIPVVFILLRIWGTIRFFRFLACLPECYLIGPGSAYTWLEILQGIGDSSQGFANFVLFCLFTDKIRKKIILVCCNSPATSDALLNRTDYGTID